MKQKLYEAEKSGLAAECFASLWLRKVRVERTAGCMTSTSITFPAKEHGSLGRSASPCKKIHEHKRQELYDYVSKEAMEKELGADLAADLIKRHLDAEKTLSAQEKGKYVIVCHACSSFARLACGCLKPFYLNFVAEAQRLPGQGRIVAVSFVGWREGEAARD